MYRISRSPMCEYMTSFIRRLKHLPEKFMMNSVLENFTILQVRMGEGPCSPPLQDVCDISLALSGAACGWCCHVVCFLQVVTNRETQETLLCLACVFEVVTNTDGPKHRVYRLIKEN